MTAPIQYPAPVSEAILPVKSSGNAFRNLFLASVVVIIVLVIIVVYLVVQNSNNVTDPTGLKPTNTLVATPVATQLPIITTAGTVSPMIYNLEFNTKTSTIANKPSGFKLLTDFKFNYPGSIQIDPRYYIDGGEFNIEFMNASNNIRYILLVTDYKIAAGNDFDSEISNRLQNDRNCMPVLSSFQKSIAFSDVTLGANTWRKASVKVTLTCNTPGESTDVDAYGLLSGNGQAVFLIGMQQPASQEIIDMLKTFSYIQ